MGSKRLLLELKLGHSQLLDRLMLHILKRPADCTESLLVAIKPERRVLAGDVSRSLARLSAACDCPQPGWAYEFGC